MKDLYHLGNKELLETHTLIGIIGARECSEESLEFCDKLVEKLNNEIENLAIVSGFARGIDIRAHRKCLELDIPCIVVFPLGVKYCYPWNHKKDKQQVLESNGLIISEYDDSISEIKRHQFLERDLIIAKLSKELYPVYATNKGGTAYTCSVARKENKKVIGIKNLVSDIHIMCTDFIEV